MSYTKYVYFQIKLKYRDNPFKYLMNSKSDPNCYYTIKQCIILVRRMISKIKNRKKALEGYSREDIKMINKIAKMKMRLKIRL